MPRRQIKLSVDNELFQKLKSEAAKQELPISSYIRTLIVKKIDPVAKVENKVEKKKDDMIFLNDILAEDEKVNVDKKKIEGQGIVININVSK